MTRDEIIRMAREAGLPLSAIGSSVYKWEDLERFAALVAEAEREACLDCIRPNSTPMEVTRAILERGTT